MSIRPTPAQLEEQARMEQAYGLLGMNQSAPAPTAAPAAPPAAAPAVSAEMSNLDRLNQLMTGGRSDYIRSLGTLDKIGLIGSVFKNINRPDAADPVQARRQQEIAGLQGRLQVEQLRAAALERQQQAAAAQQFAVTLPEAQRTAFLALAPEQQVARMETEAFKQRQVMRTVIDAEGQTINQYLDGTTGPAGFDLPPETSIETFDINGDGVNERVPVNTRTREPMTNADGTPKFFPLGMTPAEIANDLDRDASRAIQQQVANRPPSSGGGSDVKIREVPYRIQGGGTGIARGEDLGGGWFRLVDGPHAGIIISRMRPSSPDSESNL